MTLWEILKANKTGIAPDMFTMLAASKMNGGRDRLYELSGIPPLSFKAKGKPLTAWSITGNTVQNGTPTPENPVEVLGCGERTTNLFDIKKATFGKFMAENREVVSSSAVHSDYIDVSPNETYWISNFISQPRFYTGCEYNANKEFIRYIDLPRNAVSGTITTSEEGKYIVLNTDSNLSDNSFIAKSSTEIPYEPYGYKIPVVTRGKNLLEPIGFSAQVVTNINDYRIKTNNNGTSLSTVYGGSVLVTQANQIDTSASYKNGYFYIVVDFSKFTTGKNYILSFDYEIKEKPSAISSSIAYIGSSTYYAHISGNWGKDGRKSVTFTVKEGFDPYIEIRLCGNSIFVSNIQIEEGTTATPYEPYHEPITTPIYLGSPLYKIGGYADMLSTTEEVRIVKELVLTGNEHFNIDTNLRFSIYVADIKSTTNRTGRSYCSHYECLYHAEPYDDDWNNVYYQNGGTLYFHDKRFVTVTGFKEYLAAQHAAGTPVTVWYQLAKPTTETFTAPQIPTLNGTTVIDVDTAVKPESMTIKYRR